MDFMAISSRFLIYIVTLETKGCGHLIAFAILLTIATFCEFIILTSPYYYEYRILFVLSCAMLVLLQS